MIPIKVEDLDKFFDDIEGHLNHACRNNPDCHVRQLMNIYRCEHTHVKLAFVLENGSTTYRCKDCGQYITLMDDDSEKKEKQT